MQTTLLGFAFAVILALVVALVGPFFVDWTQFRPVFEAEASRVIGLPVRVTGAIDARILPSPSLSLHGLEIGPEKSEQTLHARTLNVEFALGPLLQGEFRAVEAQLVAPQITVGLDDTGAVTLPKLATGVAADALSIERLNIEDGSAQFVNAATGSRITLDKFWFNGDLRSLVGPFKGEGAFVTSGELYGYRVSAGRLGDDGSLRVRLSLDPSERPLTAEADGSLSIDKGKPRFDGTVVVSRPASLAGATTGEGKVKPPWRVETHVNGGFDDAKVDRIDFSYGTDDAGVHLNGTADLRFGRRPLFKGVLSARQLDLDRLIATRDQPTRLPADALRTLIANFAGSFAAPIPMELSFSADTVTLGGAALLMVGCDARVDSNGWALDRLEFRAPGLTQVSLSGRLDTTPALGFNGPMSIDTNDPGALASWIDGRKNATTQIRPLKLRGDVVLNQTQISIDRLKAEVDHKALDGKLHYTPAHDRTPSRLDADLNAPELDLDALLAFFDAVRSGTGLQPPSEIALGISVGRATIAGIQARNVQAQLKRDAKLLQIERLSVADLGGAKINATGRVDTSGAAPRGSLALDVEARDLDGIIALVGKFAPQAAEPLRRAAARVPAAKLRVSLGLDGPSLPTAGAKTTARLSAEGQIGGLRASVHAQVDEDSKKTASQGILAAFSGGDIRLDGQIDGDDGGALVTLLGLDKIVTVGKQPGFVNVLATGKAGGTLQVEGRIIAGALDAKATGTAKVGGDQGSSADLRLDVAHANLRLPGDNAGAVVGLPLTLHGRLVVSKEAAKFDSLTATLGETHLRGAVRIGFDATPHVSGEIEADALDAAAVIATAIGAPSSRARATGAPGTWSSDPYGAGQFADLNGRIDLKIGRAALTPSLLARQVNAALLFDGSEIALDKFDAHVAGGRLTGHLSFRHGADGLAAHARIDATGLDAATVLPSPARPAIGGRLSAKLDLEASGLSPRALVGSLAGTGTVSLDDGYFSSLDPKVFDTIVRASDQGLAVGATKIRDLVTASLDSGGLRVPRIETTLTVNAGQARIANTVAEANGAELTANGSLDLTQHQLDARLTLTGSARSDGSAGRPDIFIGLKGPISSPQRTVDVSALAGWLTIRRIDQEAKKLEALEAARLQAEASRNPAKPATTPQPSARETPTSPAAPQSLAPPSLAPSPSAMPSSARMPPNASPPDVAPSASVRPVPGAAASARPEGPRSQEPQSPAEPRTTNIAPPLDLTPDLAPPLPDAVEIRPLPRGPVNRKGGTREEAPGVPLWLPTAQPPSVMDSLVDPQQQR